MWQINETIINVKKIESIEGEIEGHIQLDVDIISSPNGTILGSLNTFLLNNPLIRNRI